LKEDFKNYKTALRAANPVLRSPSPTLSIDNSNKMIDKNLKDIKRPSSAKPPQRFY